MIMMTHPKIYAPKACLKVGYAGQCGSQSVSIVDCWTTGVLLYHQCCTTDQSPGSVVSANCAFVLTWSQRGKDIWTTAAILLHGSTNIHARDARPAPPCEKLTVDSKIKTSYPFSLSPHILSQRRKELFI